MSTHRGRCTQPSYRRVREVRVLDALPLTPTGKVLKSDLCAGLAEQLTTLR